MGATCSRVTTDVIPDREVMDEIVDTIIRFEEVMKKGERLTKAQRKQRRAIERVTKEMKSVVRISDDTRLV